jgi:hypothetical protein
VQAFSAGARTFLIACVAPVLACHLPAAEPDLSSPITRPAEISSPACTPYVGGARDTTLRGSPRTEDARCCESDFGFDPQLVASSCGFRVYQGESEELACVHRFEDAQGQTHEFRLTPIIDLEFEAAIALHERGEFDDPHTAGPSPVQPSSWISSSETRHWAFIPGWSATRRLTWEQAACDTADMLPVLTAMIAAPPPSAPITPLPRLAFPPNDPTPNNLLTLHTTAPPNASQHYPLPRAAASLIEHTLHAAATNNLATFTDAMSPTARWGLPDRRQLSARSIHSDHGAKAMQALRQTAARMPADLELHCPELDRRVIASVRTGEQPMWCVFASPDNLDILAFALRGQVINGQANATIEYIGMFPERPQHPLHVPGEPPPMPAQPQPTMICGDPHIIEYPNQCPQEDEEEDEETSNPPPTTTQPYDKR